MNKEFSGTQLAAGFVRGVRAFDVDEYGRLSGPMYPAVWKPGENHAECYVDDPYIMYKTAVQMVNGGKKKGDLRRFVHVTDAPKHSLASCSHGFYGYYDGSNDYKTQSRISAIVEGYGETLIGTRGFRSEKARIAALCIPTRRNWILPKHITARFVLAFGVSKWFSYGIDEFAKGDILSGILALVFYVMFILAIILIPLQKIWPYGVR
jgi:hypothetical protein